MYEEKTQGENNCAPPAPWCELFLSGLALGVKYKSPFLKAVQAGTTLWLKASWGVGLSTLHSTPWRSFYHCLWALCLTPTLSTSRLAWLSHLRPARHKLGTFELSKPCAQLSVSFILGYWGTKKPFLIFIQLLIQCLLSSTVSPMRQHWCYLETDSPQKWKRAVHGPGTISLKWVPPVVQLMG